MHITHISVILSFAHSRRMILRQRVLAELQCLAIRNTARPFEHRSCTLLCSPLARTIKHFFAAEPIPPPPGSPSSLHSDSRADHVPQAAPKSKLKSGYPVAPATPFIRKPVFKNTPGSPLHSVVESFAADGAVTQALEHSLDSTVAHLPDLFKSTGPPAPVAAAQRIVVTVKAARPMLLEKISTPSGLIPQRLQAPTKGVARW